MLKEEGDETEKQEIEDLLDEAIGEAIAEPEPVKLEVDLIAEGGGGEAKARADRMAALGDLFEIVWISSEEIVEKPRRQEVD